MHLPVLTHSATACFRTCPRKYRNRYVLGVRPTRSSDALQWGSAWHSMIEWHAAGTPQPAIIDDTMLVEIQCMWAGYDWYWHQNPNVPTNLAIVEWIKVELPFNVPILNPDTNRPIRSHTFSGKIDGIVRLADGRLAIVEHKTTSDVLDFGGDYLKRVRIDQQVSAYVMAAREMGYEIETVLYNIVRKPTIDRKQVAKVDDEGYKIVLDANGQRAMTKDGKRPRETGDKELGYVVQTRLETTQEYTDRLAEMIATDPAKFFMRVEIPRLDAEIAEFRHELYQQARAIADAEKHGRFYRNTAACIGFGRCEYLDSCHLGDDIAQDSRFAVVADMHPELKGTA